MRCSSLVGALGLIASASVAFAAPTAEEDQLLKSASRIITKDVVVIGGGASGSYAAVRLREDLKKSVVVVEKAPRLGGHVSSYTDPSTGRSYDFGVQSFNDIGPAKAFFQKLGIETATPGRVALTSNYIDFTDGKPLVGYTPPVAADRTAALTRYLEVCAKYEDLITPGYYKFPAPKDIPEDLLMTFGEFAVKYNITAAVPQIFSLTGLGVGDVTKELTLYVMQAFGASMARSFLGQGATFVPASKRNQDVYDKVAALLGNDVLYSTTVVASVRTGLGVALLVREGDGRLSAILAKRLLIAIEPTEANMKPFALDRQEEQVFGKFEYSNIYAGIVSHPSLPVNISLANTAKAGIPTQYLAQFPQGNFLARFDYLGEPSKLWRVLLVGDTKFSSCKAKQQVIATLDRLIAAGTLPATVPASQLQFAAWADHGAMHARVSKADLKAGFAQSQYDLQGRRGTYFTGAAFSAQFQAIVWQFTDTILPKLTAGI